MTQEKVTATVVNATATPINTINTIQNTANEMNNVLNDLSNGMNRVLNELPNEAPKTETAEEKKAKSFLNKFKSYITSETFKKDINETAKKYNIPPKQLAQNFFEKALGTVGDILGIVISAVTNAGHMVINIVGTVAHGIINLITNIANGLCSLVTLNKTCISQ